MPLPSQIRERLDIYAFSTERLEMRLPYANDARQRNLQSDWQTSTMSLVPVTTQT